MKARLADSDTRAATPAGQAALDEYLLRGKLKVIELLPWVLCIAAFFALPDYLPLLSQVLVMIILALSLDLLVGYAGIVTLGHAAFFGIGAYAAGMLSLAGMRSVPGALVAGAIASAAAAGLVGTLILRTRGLALLMLTMAVPLLLKEIANRFPRHTGGADGLQGIEFHPLFGAFEFDMFGRTAYVLAVAVAAATWLAVRYLTTTPFGKSLLGIRDNPIRMSSLGVSVRTRKLLVFVLAGAVAGLAGALSTVLYQFVSLSVFSFELSGTLLVMLAIGGVGRLYGAFIGAPLYVIAQDTFSKSDPVFWLFWLGLGLVVLVMAAPGGILSFAGRLRAGRSLKRARDRLMSSMP